MTKQEQLIIILLILAALIGTGLLYLRKFHEPTVTPEVVEVKEGKNSNQLLAQEVVVDVKGACWRPGVYTMPYGSRIKDLMERVSPREDADLTGINLASRLKDGEKIFIPSRVSPSSKGMPEGPPGVSDERYEKININIASSEELQKLPQIGPKIANYIIDYRMKNGPFRDIEEIKNVDKVGEKTFEKIKNLIAVE